MVTLILGMSQPEGIYLSVDYRVTDSRSGRILDDSTTKHLTIHYPPAEGGPRALVAYTGVAVLPDGTETGRWVRETLRGESEVFDVSMQHLLDRLNRDYARLRHPLVINFLVIYGERRYFGGMSNLYLLDSKVRVRPKFAYEMKELDAPFVFANGSGALSSPAQRQLERLRCQLGTTPNRPMDYMRLLSLVNREIASGVPSVSPYCHVAFVNSASYRFGPESRAFTNSGESVPFDFPVLLFGIDLSESTKRFMKQSQEFFAGRITEISEPHPDQLNEELERRP